MCMGRKCHIDEKKSYYSLCLLIFVSVKENLIIYDHLMSDNIMKSQIVTK